VDARLELGFEMISVQAALVINTLLLTLFWTATAALLALVTSNIMDFMEVMPQPLVTQHACRLPLLILS